MADVVIRHGIVVDGTGAARRVADVAIKDGKILAVGAQLDIRGDEEVDGTGRLVCPGWVDCHTHYDAQVGWDSQMSPSCWHGVTTVVFVRLQPPACAQPAVASTVEQLPRAVSCMRWL